MTTSRNLITGKVSGESKTVFYGITVPFDADSSKVSPSAPAIPLSYASENAPAAERIAAALRQGGIETWLDRSELRGGDAWDAEIRRQIKSCTLCATTRLKKSARRSGLSAVTDGVEDQLSLIDHELQAFADFGDTPLGQQSVVSSRKFAS
jgi:TIR domain